MFYCCSIVMKMVGTDVEFSGCVEFSNPAIFLFIPINIYTQRSCPRNPDFSSVRDKVMFPADFITNKNETDPRLIYKSSTESIPDSGIFSVLRSSLKKLIR